MRLLSLTKRNIKMFFKDKAMFFTSLITPLILLVLYATFLAKVYRDSFTASSAIEFSDKIIGGVVGGQLVASLVSVCCVTVAFCSNMLMVQDKISGAKNDILISGTKSSTLALSYYLSTMLTTLIVCIAGMAICFVYLAIVGWYISFLDILLLLLDIILLTSFGTAISSIINLFLTSQGQISAVGTIVSAGYGFISGAYMPISQFGVGLQRVMSFLPGTYGTALIKNHTLRGVLAEMVKLGTPNEVIKGIKDSIDANLYIFGHNVNIATMYAIMIISNILLIGLYVFLSSRYGHKRIVIHKKSKKVM